jgi:CDP-glucose 4,6-dehydratase
MIDREFWERRRVFVTGHTGFKGSWLTLWLSHLGASITGYSLDPPTKPNLFEIAGIADLCHSLTGDIRDLKFLTEAMKEADPEVVVHLAAQALVRASYRDPVGTYTTNVLGTLNVLESVRSCSSVRAVVVVTTDKVYENREWHWGYRENDGLGGYDPYSSSKSCAELLTAACRKSFFDLAEYGRSHNIAIATARAGNVVGGGDWAEDRLIPDCVRALTHNSEVVIRNPQAVRPWQHVLDPLSGYLELVQALWRDGMSYSEAWNFGPDDDDAKSVEWVVTKVSEMFSGFRGWVIDDSSGPAESVLLRLDCSKARQKLGWRPIWRVEDAIRATFAWVDRYMKFPSRMREYSLSQIEEYEACGSKNSA